MTIKTCQCCGEEFAPKQFFQMYCSSYCHLKDWRSKNPPKSRSKKALWLAEKGTPWKKKP